METLYELGVDINNDFNFKDGDLNLVEYDENLIQAITNKLNTNLNEMELFYEEYGSVIQNFLGWKGNEETIQFIKSEMETILKSEERLTSWEYEINIKETGSIQIDLTLYPNMEYSIETTININEEGAEVDE